ncbi:MAG TPA: DUF1080 domain-containing protein [Tepidisphaeraceae bacterium]|nr:DUF1080 domain-containing protein [Tepidisphaeraceae bacterium]
MHRSIALWAVAVSLIAPSSYAGDAAKDDAPPAGFVSLFDGKTLDGWKLPEGDNGHWKIVDGVIDYDGASEAKGDKGVWTTKEFGDFVLRVDWRIKEAPYINPNVPYVLPDGSHARGVDGKPLKLALPDSDSGVILRGNVKNQANIWCWPIGSGEFYGYRMDQKMPPEVRAGVTPKHQADKPVGQWNRFEITCKGDRVTVVLNGVTVIENAQLPGIAPKGPLGLQHHGGKDKEGKWNSPPALVQFRNVYVKELVEGK